MKSLGLLLLRLTFGGLMMGHGAQKLFGAFEGHGPEGTGQFLESMGMRPGRFWAHVAGWCEFGGGALTALGLMHPAGPMLTIAPMVMATTKAHAGKPIWVTSGGAELPVTNMAIAGALLLAGPGWFSVDKIFRTRAPFWLVAVVLGGLGYGLYNVVQPTEEQRQQVVETAERAFEVVKERIPNIAA